MTSRGEVLPSLVHKQPARIPIDFGSTAGTGIHATCVLVGAPEPLESSRESVRK
jgi:hypothetical protein